MGYLFRIILKYKNGFLTKKIRFFDKNFERLQIGKNKIKYDTISNRVRMKTIVLAVI